MKLHDIPGGAKAFLLVAKFCYGVKLELTALNVVELRCAAEYLRMNEDFGNGNLIMQCENFLNEVFGNWTDSIKALETCEGILSYAEELHIVSRCINSLAMKACSDPSLFSWPVSGPEPMRSSEGTEFWNGIHVSSRSRKVQDDWWFEDVSFLRLPLYKRLILEVGSRGMKPDIIAGSLIHYARRHLPLLGRQASNDDRTFSALVLNVSASASSEVDQRRLLEEIVELLPHQKGVTPTKFLIRLLRTSTILHASFSCRENLEKRIGSQLEQAALEDLLIPNMGYSVETLYDIDCIQRILDHFMLVDRNGNDCILTRVEDGQLMGSNSVAPLTMVANLIDGYLAEVAPDVNLKLPKFQSLAAAIPDFARPLDDGIYRAIDIYLKAHHWLTDSEREQICRLMNCQKLSLEASTHAAQNERLPLRVVVQVLFFEQLRLRTSVASWLFLSDNIENSHNISGNMAALGGTNNAAPYDNACTTENHAFGIDNNMKERVSELEKECLSMKEELDKLVKTKGGWNMILKKLGLRIKFKNSEQKPSKLLINSKPDREMSSTSLPTNEQKRTS
ncbi:BTB/POZ domain-containing protein At5g03250-like [Cucurbita moschata]|uniref:BTB/POZ domain-containing protein At5g03250-like n=1 Tax=Cucurbita moschata TaxID=3662 RepID=A0A6J1GWC3_CUCMO|nr:BTB/POZ domain-containing protein At5g03250-like [Cucurbita moschata]